jgi:galactonate dehydratase
MPNFLITEYFVNLEEFGRQVASPPFEVENGYIKLPTTPGLGIDLDEEALMKFPYQPFAPRSPRQYYEEGP